MRLCDFPILGLRFVCQFKGSFVYSRMSFPNLLRGCFGNAMLKSENSAVQTLYEEMFKPEIADPMMERYNDVPKPFVLNPFLMRKKQYKPGDLFDLGINIFGPFVHSEEIICQAFCEMGRLGFADGETPFAVKEVVICRDPDKMILDAGKKIELDFYSPLQIREHGKYVRKPSFASVFRRIYGRIRTIAYFYENEELEDDMSALFEILPQVKTASCRMTKTDYCFRVSQNGAKQRFDGQEGKIVYEFPSEKDLNMFVPWLSKGMYLNLGKMTSWGMGAYNFRVAD